MTCHESYHKQLTAEVLNTNIHQHLDVKLVSQGLENRVPAARCSFISTEKHLVSIGSVHGGVSSLIIDMSCYLAVIPTLEPGQGTATVASSFQILGAVQGVGKKYEVEARVVRRGKSVVFCEGEVRCEGRLIAKGSLTKIVTKGKTGASKL